MLFPLQINKAMQHQQLLEQQLQQEALQHHLQHQQHMAGTVSKLPPSCCFGNKIQGKSSLHLEQQLAQQQLEEQQERFNGDYESSGVND